MTSKRMPRSIAWMTRSSASGLNNYSNSTPCRSTRRGNVSRSGSPRHSSHFLASSSTSLLLLVMSGEQGETGELHNSLNQVTVTVSLSWSEVACLTLHVMMVRPLGIVCKSFEDSRQAYRGISKLSRSSWGSSADLGESWKFFEGLGITWKVFRTLGRCWTPLEASCKPSASA